MDAKKILTYLGIGGTVFGIVGTGLQVAQTVDQMKNGVKLRDDQLASLSVSISNQVSNTMVDNYSLLASNIVQEYYKQTKGQN